MILNAWSVTTGFLAGIGFLLAAVGLATALGALTAGSRAQDRARLAFMIGGVLLILRCVAWPLFYATLASFVPELATQGVMCAFGVTRLDPGRVHALELAKPAALALLGADWLLAGAPLALGTLATEVEAAAVRRVRLVLVTLASALVLVECGLELSWLLAEKGGRAVTCCSTFFGSEEARVDASIGWLAPLRGLGDTAELALLFGGGAVAIAGALWLRRAAGGAVASAGTFLLAVLALAQGAVALQVWIDVVAPRVLGLPYHHCPYELLTGTLALGPAAALGVLGRAALVLPAGLLLVLGRSAPRSAQVAGRCALGLGALWLASELALTAAHLI